MINILQEKQKIMKLPKSQQRDASLIVLNEIRTMEMLQKEKITSKMQYKWFEKMLATRNTASNIYKTKNRMDLYDKENNEANAIKKYMSILEEDMPKQMSETEVTKIIVDIKRNNPSIQIGDIMKYFSKNYPNQNKSMVSAIFRNLN